MGGGNIELNAARSEYKQSEIVTALMRSECRLKGFASAEVALKIKF